MGGGAHSGHWRIGPVGRPEASVSLRYGSFRKKLSPLMPFSFVSKSPDRSNNGACKCAEANKPQAGRHDSEIRNAVP